MSDNKLFKSQELAEANHYYTKTRCKKLGIKPDFTNYHYIEKQWSYGNKQINRTIPVFAPLFQTNNKSIINQSLTNQLTNPPYDTPFWKNRNSPVNNKPTELQLTVPENWWDGITFPNKTFPDKANYILALICWGQIFRKQQRTPIKMKYLQNVIGWRYTTQILNWLEQSNLIECDHSFQKGKKCFHYWLSPQLKNRKYQSVYASKKIINQLKKHDNKELTMIQNHIKEEMARITIEEREALKCCNKDFSQEFIVKSIAKKQWRLDPDDYGRIHTNITNLNKEARKLIRIDGEETAEPDIACCQILELAKIALDSGVADANKLLEVCEQGQFYELFGSNRDKVKDKIYVELLFGRMEYTYKSEICSEFNKLFPAIYAWIIAHKKANYKYLSHRLQRLESKIMIDGVGNKLKELGIPFHPIYDSMLCKKSQAELVAKIIREQWQAEGMNPIVKIK